MSPSLRSQRLGALFAAGWFLLNFPLLALWDSEATLGGIPLFPLALFGIWACLIALVAWWLEGTAAELDSAAVTVLRAGHSLDGGEIRSALAAPTFPTQDKEIPAGETDSATAPNHTR